MPADIGAFFEGFGRESFGHDIQCSPYQKSSKYSFPVLPLEKESGVKISVEKRLAVAAAVGENMEIVR